MPESDPALGLSDRGEWRAYRVKGNLLAARPRYVREKWGDAGYADVASRLRPPARAILEGTILPFAWYDFPDMAEIDQAIVAGPMGGDVSKMKAFGATIATRRTSAGEAWLRRPSPAITPSSRRPRGISRFTSATRAYPDGSRPQSSFREDGKSAWPRSSVFTRAARAAPGTRRGSRERDESRGDGTHVPCLRSPLARRFRTIFSSSWGKQGLNTT
jgi:hypothetical protein